MKSVGDRIKSLRIALGMTQEELGEKLHVRKQTVYKWEKDINIPDADTVKQLSYALNCSADFLVGKTDKPSEKVLENDIVKIKVEKESYPYDLTPEQVDLLINKLRSYDFNIDKIIKAVQNNEIDREF